MPLVLYVARSKVDPTQLCRGSELCIQEISERGLSDLVTVQEVEKVRQQVPLPPWIDGTPILVDTEEMIPLRGSVALRELRRMGPTKRGGVSRGPPPKPRKGVVEEESSMLGPVGGKEEMLPFPPAQNSMGGGGGGVEAPPSNTNRTSASLSRIHEEEEEEEDMVVYSDSDRPTNTGKVTEKDLQAFIASRKR